MAAPLKFRDTASDRACIGGAFFFSFLSLRGMTCDRIMYINTLRLITINSVHTTNTHINVHLLIVYTQVIIFDLKSMKQGPTAGVLGRGDGAPQCASTCVMCAE